MPILIVEVKEVGDPKNIRFEVFINDSLVVTFKTRPMAEKFAREMRDVGDNFSYPMMTRKK